MKRWWLGLALLGLVGLAPSVCFAQTNWDDTTTATDSSDIDALRQSLEESSKQESSILLAEETARLSALSFPAWFGYTVLLIYLAGWLGSVFVFHLHPKARTWAPEWVILGSLVWWLTLPLFLIYSTLVGKKS